MSKEITTNNTPLLKKVSKNFVVSGILGILILTASLQALELNQMKGYVQGFLQGQEFKTASVAASDAAPTAAPAQPVNNAYPSQVGGC